ncbi:MAG: DUF4304 domain-containing protein [Lachnospiraceae bacterium]|nr:DUF4304 domain-containing protein [Lachnospiraceae bacterium]
MDKTEFKKVIRSVLSNYGFQYKKNNYYRQTEKLVIIVNLQKSNYQDSFYVNYGFIIRAIHENVEYPKITESDIDGRLCHNLTETDRGSFFYENMSCDALEKSLCEVVEKTFSPLFDDDLERFFDLFPSAIHSASRLFSEYYQCKK